MKYQIFITMLFALFLTNSMRSQYLNKSIEIGTKTYLTGNLDYDILIHSNQRKGPGSLDSVENIMKENKYSPLSSALFSAVVPGAGQFYTKSYIQSATFFGAEVLSWIVYAVYEKKGDRQTNSFQQYADQNWSVVRYANWINLNFGMTINIKSNPNNNLKPWQLVDWTDLNNAEDQIAGNQNIQPTGFTHKLAPYGDQQYYEMIGKYSQFGGGWDDAASFTKMDVLANNGIGNVTQHFLDYRNMRGDANKFYNIASTVSYIIVANHVFSALEAALNASKINHRIQLQGHIQSRSIYGNFIEFVPTFHVKYEL